MGGVGKPVVEFENVENIWNPDEHEMIICVGYSDMNRQRQIKFKEVREKGYHIVGYRHPSSIVLTDDIGEGNIIMEGAVIGQSCKLGEGNVIWPMAHIAHHTTVGNYNFFTISCAIAGNITIGNNCVFGNNCTVKNGITIADYTLVGAAAYVRYNTEMCGVYVPAKTYQLLGKESFEILL